MNNQILIGLIRHAHAGLTRTVSAIPDDKMTWKPLDNGRTVLDLLGDAAQTAGLTAQMAQTRGEVKPSYEMFQQLKAERENWTREDAMRALEDNAQKLYAAIEQLSNEELGKMVTAEVGGGLTFPLSAWMMMMAYRTFISRFAQINYIQSLYGDFERH